MKVITDHLSLLQSEHVFLMRKQMDLETSEKLRLGILDTSLSQVTCLGCTLDRCQSVTGHVPWVQPGQDASSSPGTLTYDQAL